MNYNQQQTVTIFGINIWFTKILEYVLQKIFHFT